MLNGTYTAPASIAAPQQLTLTAQSAADSTAQGTATVNLQPPLSVSVTPSTVTLKASGQQVFTATVTGSANQNVAWSISPNVGSMLNGTYTAPASIASPQVVTVTAQSAADSTAQGTATVNLQPPVSVSVSPSSVTLGPSGQQVFTATVTGSTNQ